MSSKPNYNQPIRLLADDENPGDDVLSVAGFLDAVGDSYLIDDDGVGHPARDGFYDHDIHIHPSNHGRDIPEDATHVVWFNK